MVILQKKNRQSLIDVQFSGHKTVIITNKLSNWRRSTKKRGRHRKQRKNVICKWWIGRESNYSDGSANGFQGKLSFASIKRESRFMAWDMVHWIIKLHPHRRFILSHRQLLPFWVKVRSLSWLLKYVLAIFNKIWVIFLILVC